MRIPQKDLPLTARQEQLLAFIVQQIRDQHFPPSVSEMVRFLDVRSKNDVAKILYVLQVKGYIEISGKARGIIVLHAGMGDTPSRTVQAPIMGNVQAGRPHGAEEYLDDWVNLPEKLVKKRKDVFLLKVRGDSMIKAGIFSGDLVIVEPTKEANHNDIVVALFHNEATVKRLIRIKNRTYLKPENPRYENIYPKDEWTIQGKVVGVIQRYS